MVKNLPRIRGVSCNGSTYCENCSLYAPGSKNDFECRGLPDCRNLSSDGIVQSEDPFARANEFDEEFTHYFQHRFNADRFSDPRMLDD